MRALLKFAADTYSSELPLPPATSADDDVPVESDNLWYASSYVILSILLAVLFLAVMLICWPRRGLKESALKALPKTRYKKAAGIENQPECVICLTEFEEEVCIRKLPQCGHEFHVECIDKWLLSRASCPSCRAEVVQSPQSQEAG